MSRILCVDYGRSRVGLAVSDPLGATAQPLEVVDRPKKGSLLDAVLEVATRVGAEEIVVGLPLRMDGGEGPSAQAARQFAEAMSERTDVPIVLWDERLSTVEASRRMRSAGVKARDQRGTVDKVAAAVVLRSYLETKSQGSSLPPDAVLPTQDVDEGPPPEPIRHDPGGEAARKRRRIEKRHRHRRERQGWEPDPEDL